MHFFGTDGRSPGGQLDELQPYGVDTGWHIYVDGDWKGVQVH